MGVLTRTAMAAAILLAGLFASLAASSAKPASTTPFYSSTAILQWINTYRTKPDPVRAMAAMHELGTLGELRSQESAGVYVGFAAGVLAANPAKADALVDKMLPMAAEDQWFVVRAVAYSGIPNWRNVLTRIAPRLPARGPMLKKYLDGQLPVLAQFMLEPPKPDWKDRMAAYVSIDKKEKPKPVVLTPSPEVLDTFWGFYFASGDMRALQSIITMLPWAKDRDDIERLTLGGMAKYTLASNATRNPVLLATIKTIRNSQSEDVRKVLDEVIEAADDVDVTRIRKEMVASLDELKRKGSATKRDITLWGQVGQGAVAAGCIAAAVAGAVALGIPCVVGGAVSTGALNVWSSQN